MEEVLESDGYRIQSVLNSDILNPVDSYNLIKRTARTWPKVKDALNASDVEKENEEKRFSSQLQSVLETFPSWEKNRWFCSYLICHHHHDISLGVIFFDKITTF